ncbi:MAG TPA: sigma 54-interacting transcriptional regulator [Polyangia bacterium]|jgi:DNA-binding NtrC family response regulator
MNKSRGPETIAIKRRDPAAYATARLVVTPPEGPEHSLVLGLSHVRIGAGSSNDVVLDDPHASRFHCELRKTDEGYLLRDLGSLNGTRVGDLVVKEGLLTSGATITVGETRIRFLTDDGKPEEVVASPHHQFGQVVGRSLRMREVFALLERVANTELTVLIGGETGSGKDVIARALHAESQRAKKPFVVFDCAAVAPNLIESELFGHVKGAFTGASESREGAFVRADGGTLFLDEIGELAIDLQPKLLRVLEQRTVRPVGGGKEQPIDVRIIAATHRSLEQIVKEGNFRQDLFFRLSVVTVQVPPLRHHIEDLPLIIEKLLLAGGKAVGLAPETMTILEKYDWPGNVRELRNVIESAAAVCDGEQIEPKHLMFFKPRRRDPTFEKLPLAGKTLESIEKAAIAQTLQHCGGNKTRAARALGISPSTLYEKVKKYSL